MRKKKNGNQTLFIPRREEKRKQTARADRIKKKRKKKERNSRNHVIEISRIIKKNIKKKFKFYAAASGNGGGCATSIVYHVQMHCLFNLNLISASIPSLNPFFPLSVTFLKQHTMCKQSQCPNCSKISWIGCGLHIPSALQASAKEEWCTCAHPEDSVTSKDYPPKSGTGIPKEH